jgi:hypothetical protein
VILHVLVTGVGDGMTLDGVAVACERDPNSAHERAEVEAALELLREDGLAEAEDTTETGKQHRPDEPRGDRDQDGGSAQDGDGQREGLRFRATRAAVRASELSF